LQVISNLLNNAAKYTPAGGRIDLDVTTDAATKRLTLKVKDTGVGIDPELLPKVFDLFMQEDRSLSRAGGGLGIGLTLVKNLVEMHGGAVTAASDGQGKGSEFTVVLPFHPADGGNPAAPPPPPQPAGGRLKVVVIDDNADAADTTGMLLEAWGHAVVAAYDGPSGLEVVRREKPDVVLMDIGLPGLNGYEVAGKLKDEGLVPPLMVAVTGYGHEADRQRAEWAGFHNHIVKPAKPDDLARILASAGRAKHAAAEQL
jgi:CheY-like chemotaxis protein